MNTAQPPQERLGYRPADAAKVLGVARNTVYTYLRAGTLRAKKLGSATIIPAEELARFLNAADDFEATRPQ